MKHTHPVPRIALTPGEPAGIGPDLCVLLAQQKQSCEIVAIASPDVLEKRAQELRLPLKLNPFHHERPARQQKAGELSIFPVDLDASVRCGELNRKNARYVLKTITKAAKGCLEGTFNALVTGPIHKGVINDAGITFSGHTEYIAHITGGTPVMMLTAPGLRVALATTHLPLSKVSQALTQNHLRSIIRILHQDLCARFSIAHPEILVCGLNPHAGEGGHLGTEEIRIIEPVLNGLRKLGMNLVGPLPADTVFLPKRLESADAVLAMYHDQGLPVLKHIGFGQAVNITLGLPIVRTSVDHGTALDLAGTGEIETGSLQYAINSALEIANNLIQ